MKVLRTGLHYLDKIVHGLAEREKQNSFKYIEAFDKFLIKVKRWL